MNATPAAPRALFFIGGRNPVAKPGSVEEMGFKASNLAAMAVAGLPVPQAFVLSTRFASRFQEAIGGAPGELRDALAEGVRHIERESRLCFGGRRRPLLVSVRSGAPVSMPGMMETVLDVGVNDVTVEAIIRSTGNPRLAWDCYRRLVQGFAEVVHECPAHPFAARLDACLAECGAASTREIDFRSLAALTRDFLSLFEEHTGSPFPQDPLQQLEAAALAVIRSWQGAKAVSYRRARGIDDGLGTAVTVQRMVFGNAGGLSGAGVAFSRDPSTGANGLYMDFLFNAQGEDVVSGRHALEAEVPLGRLLPDTLSELEGVSRALELQFRDAQEFEFTIEDATLFLLQTRSAKRTPWASLRIAVEQVEAGLISAQEGLARLAGVDLERVEELGFAHPEDLDCLADAVTAGIGIAVGRIALDVEAAQRLAADGDEVVLLRHETATSDIDGIVACAGILTAVGGRTSHAAVVARQLGKVCLVGCSELVLDLPARCCRIAGRVLAEGDWLCLDGHSGRVFAGQPALLRRRPSEWLQLVAGWQRACSASPGQEAAGVAQAA
jgi:pyruvate,orthophosphate dikinase